MSFVFNSLKNPLIPSWRLPPVAKRVKRVGAEKPKKPKGCSGLLSPNTEETERRRHGGGGYQTGTVRISGSPRRWVSLVQMAAPVSSAAAAIQMSFTGIFLPIERR